ncbi:MAG: ExbD/TolR family protein [Planctomycetota bacterium]
MALLRPIDDEAKANMTPMIDMTFLLVVFFMLTIDLTTKEFVAVALPYAKKCVEDVTPPLDAPPRLVINLLPSGDIIFKGNTWPLGTGSREDKANALINLRQELQVLTANPRWREEDRSSKVSVMIHGDRNARWQYVQWIMQICADPRIGIYKIQFAVKGPPPGEEEGQGGG